MYARPGVSIQLRNPPTTASAIRPLAAASSADGANGTPVIGSTGSVVVEAGEVTERHHRLRIMMLPSPCMGVRYCA